MYVVSFVDTRYFLAQGFHSRDSIQLTSIFLLFINILLVKTSFLRAAAVGTLITRIPCIFNIETKPICSEQCPTWTELTCWWGPDSGWGTMHQIRKKRAILNSFFWNFYHHSAVRKKLDKTLILAFEAKSIRFSSSIIFFVKSYFRQFFFWIHTNGTFFRF